jgi:hypothetical protein
MVIRIISRWADGVDHRTICWLFGPAGTGKSTIAHTIAERYATKGRLAASFFFSLGNGDLSTTVSFFPTIAYQLAISLPHIRKDMEKALEDDPLIPSKTPEVQFTKLILNPIRHHAQFHPMQPMLIVIDGLDECDGEDSTELIRVLAKASRPPLQFLITSRADDHIKATFTLYSSLLYPLDLWEFRANHDIRAFFKDRFSELYRSKRRLMGRLPEPWPTDSDLDVLVKKAEGLFIYASTLVKFVGEGRGLPQKKLTAAMAHHDGLDALYEQVLSKAPSSASDIFQRIIGSLLVLRGSLSIINLASLLRFEDPETIWEELTGCGSILMIPDDLDKDIQFFHASLRDFFTDICRSKNYFIDATEHHLFILDDCVRLMTDYFTLPLDRKPLPHAFLYAHGNWYHHMAEVVQKDNGIERIKTYFNERLVNFLACIKDDWFEALWPMWNSRVSHEGEVFLTASIIKVSVSFVNYVSENCDVCSRINKEISLPFNGTV